MRFPTYDIFCGHVDKDAVWIETVDGLGAATDRMKQLAEEKPGPYFVFCTETHKVLASIHTFARHNSARRASA
jgi:hypothetical protein